MAYKLVNDQRNFFKNKKLMKRTTAEPLEKWYGDVEASRVKTLINVGLHQCKAGSCAKLL